MDSASVNLSEQVEGLRRYNVPLEGAPLGITLSSSLLPGDPHLTADHLRNLFGEISNGDLVDFWKLTNGGYLFKDLHYGQMGLDIFSPDGAARRMAARYFDDRALQFGDVLLGEFVADPDCLVVNRVDGLVRPSITGYDYSHWPVFSSISGFISQYVDATGEKFWD